MDMSVFVSNLMPYHIVHMDYHHKSYRQINSSIRNGCRIKVVSLNWETTCEICVGLFH